MTATSGFLSLAMETEVRVATKVRADAEAIRVFVENLRQLLLSPPLGQKNVLAIDPGFRTGCKVVCVDRQGKLLTNDTIYPHFSEKEDRRGRHEDHRTVQKVQHRGDRHRKRYGRPGDGGLCPAARPSRRRSRS